MNGSHSGLVHSTPGTQQTIEQEELKQIVENNESSSRLPNYKNGRIPDSKVSGYALDPTHPTGKNKARVFQSALGFNQSNAGKLVHQIYEKVGNCPAIKGKCDEYGIRYSVDIPITGPNGKTKTVRTAWIITPDSSAPSLTSLYVKED